MVHYEFRRLEASQSWSSIDETFLGIELDSDQTRQQIIAGFESFVNSTPPMFRSLGVEHRVIRDTPMNEFECLLDAVFSWTRTPGFRGTCPTYDSYLVAVLAILEPSLYLIARDHQFTHPVLGRAFYDDTAKFGINH